MALARRRRTAVPVLIKAPSQPQHLCTWQVVVEFKRVCRKAVDASLQSQSTFRCTHLPALKERERERGLGLLPGTERSTLAPPVGQRLLSVRAATRRSGGPPACAHSPAQATLCGPIGEATPLWCQETLRRRRLQQRSGACTGGARLRRDDEPHHHARREVRRAATRAMERRGAAARRDRDDRALR